MQIIDGRKIANIILEKVKIETGKLNFQPVFCDVLVGSDLASVQYVKMKAKLAEKIGIKFREAVLPENITTQELVREIHKISKEPNMSGLIIQLPLPEHIDRKVVLDSIPPEIDVDCTGEINSDLFYKGTPYLSYPAAEAVLTLLKSEDWDLNKKNILIVGHGQLVGRPVSFLLEQMGLRPNIATNETANLNDLIEQAEVIISAAGQPKLIGRQNIKKGVIIIDAGTSELEGGVAGDVDFERLKNHEGFISKNPGGVGPLTVAMLLKNVLKVAQRKNLGA